MDSLLKALTAVVPFIGRCPTWFQVAVIVWLVLTAILSITGFVLATRSSFAIIQPREGAVVEVGDTVQFVSPHSDLNHYVIVTPLQAPTRWVVDGPLRVSAGELQHGNTRFGDTDAGRGERFSLQILATADQLRQGALDKLPSDSKLSQAIKVIRAR